MGVAKEAMVQGTPELCWSILGKMFLLLVDSHSKWIDVHITNASTTAVTIEKIQFTFSSLGLPEILVTDNGPSFSSSEFTDFVKANGIQHIKTVLYHPAYNGLAERAVQTFKACMKKLSNGSLQDQVNSFFLKYRTTPQTTTGVSPTELLMGCKLRTHLDLLVPDNGGKVRMRKNLQKHSHDLHTFSSASRLTIVSHKAKKKHSNASTE